MNDQRRIGCPGTGYWIAYCGHRLADVMIGNVPVECVQVRDYDFATGEFGPEPTDDQVRERVAEFLADQDWANYVEQYEFYRKRR